MYDMLRACSRRSSSVCVNIVSLNCLSSVKGRAPDGEGLQTSVNRSHAIAGVIADADAPDQGAGSRAEASSKIQDCVEQLEDSLRSNAQQPSSVLPTTFALLSAPWRGWWQNHLSLIPFLLRRSSTSLIPLVLSPVPAVLFIGRHLLLFRNAEKIEVHQPVDDPTETI